MTVVRAEEEATVSYVLAVKAAIADAQRLQRMFAASFPGAAAELEYANRIHVAALTELAAHLEQIEQSLPNIAYIEGREAEYVEYCRQLAAGFTDPNAALPADLSSPAPTGVAES